MSIQYTADQLQRKFHGPPGAPGFPRLADVLRKEGKIDEAIQMCQDGLRVRPNTLSAYVVLGKALMDAGRMEDARDQFEAALRLDSRCLSAMHFLARIMTKMQWAEAAAGYYRSILEVEPWDSEIRALLGESSPQIGSFPGAASNGNGHASALQAQPIEEDTFHKPEGLAGDVLEVSLNDLAADFLPGQDPSDTASMGLGEESLEDALSSPYDAFDSPQAAASNPEDMRKSRVPESLAEPQPQDVFKTESLGQADAADGDAPPISGQDVEDRLDSLFGSEDGPTESMRSATATWSPAPAEAPAVEAPEAETAGPEAPIDFSLADPSGQEGSATASGEMRAADMGGISPIDLASVPDLPNSYAAEAMAVGDYSAVDFVTPSPDLARRDDSQGAEMDEGGRVQGEDIERRLDELFNLTEADDLPPAAIASASLPVAPAPRVDEAVSMGEVVSFGGEVAFRDPGAAEESFATAGETTMSSFPDAGTSESRIEDLIDIPAETAEEIITGQDVADKLDNLFGVEAPAPVEAKERVPEPVQDFEPKAAAETVPEPAAEPMAKAGPKPWMETAEPSQPPATGDIMSTESMLPPGWFGDAGDGPTVTGSDVEDQLDKLFNLQDEGDAFKAPGAQSGPGDVNTGDTATFKAPISGGPEQTYGMAMPDGGAPAGGAPGDESDMTVMMPAMTEPLPAQDTRVPKDAGRIKESVADWLARQNGESESKADEPGAVFNSGMEAAGDTLILPHEDIAANGEDAEMFGTLAPEDMAGLSDTASIEMVDGVDIAERLDELFAGEGLASARGGVVPESDATSGGTEMSLFTHETGESPDFASEATDAAGNMVSGEDVSSRLQDIFEAGSAQKPAVDRSPTETGVPTGMETDEELPPITDLGKPSAQPAPELAPMLDEEDGYPEEEEMPSGTGAGANVATVTLAEIYFQQGLREQALQIYRQLLEREPENESVRKRIEEIEAVKPEGGDRGPGTDPRRPRPGLKVPKRKK
ncbi:MAG: hypothetical protein JWO30_3045 [Fibrobacteres bacterium]|nr:hypothetical protein [Fibrobacterota bacterium]